MKRKISCGIDVGTHAVRVVIVARDNPTDAPNIIGRGFALSSGMRMGYITNTDSITNSIKQAVAQAQTAANVKIKRAYISAGGIGMMGETITGSVIISRADKEVTTLDITNALGDCEENLNTLNKKIVHIIPIQYKLDGKEIHGRPEGMKGVKLEVKALFVTITKQHIEDLATAITESGIEVIDIVANIVAEANLLLTEKQKMAGCALLDIGFSTVTLGVYEDGVLLSLAVFPIGGMDITKDIALGFKVSLDDAEGIKVGTVVGDYPKKRVDEIIDARLGDIFELVENHLKRIKRSGLLPAGVIITGGGAQINTIESVVKQYLRLPARAGYANDPIISKYKMKDDSWYTALGLALLQGTNSSSTDSPATIGDNIKDVKGFFRSMLSQLLP